MRYCGCINGRPPWWEPGLSKVPSKPVVGHENIALYVVPAHGASMTYLVSVSPAHSTSFSPNFSKNSMVECVLSSESEFYLW